MRWMFIFLIAFSFLQGCDIRKREEQLENKQKTLQQKEQELVAWQNSLNLKDEELTRREQLLDSTRVMTDTLANLFPTIPGTYNTTMRCTETNCAGSAVGDTRTEQWEIAFQNNSIIIKAMNDDKLVRVYSGTYASNGFELLAQTDNTTPTPDVKMVVRIQPAKENTMIGTREIYRTNDCRIVYDLTLAKQ